ncbi:folate-sensitive fragile site protein Fra10Ac1-domain-containing protein [Gamsiella multidivaricata]|uniref:folate-sensitive fragile site protein Fra10Ac1-domain-containing protein n=1 Tax=Gamsiella multidivaricata TaxID=101098 RepID=UPI002221026B|nr:folate-sensitive fragile site protein Fra10Ac1-domain-containing protein [Gamsiella multidivaricata]KAG0367081.1 hypothetical protein BGZ54_004426 [Gamsiella multidivaricata]KAI7820005.1 folate-sensitive fragile site protein Fra10Ac1-domain-containing protein [Gamsiella multidivaricata]
MDRNQMQTTRKQEFARMDSWSKHKHLIDSFVKYHRKSDETSQQQDKSYKTERDILVENHRFLRSEQDDQDLAWEERIAKKYYDKLFKEYALVELKYYKEGRIAMRWRNEGEVFRGKGQFTCGNLQCDELKGLQSWEVNFGYVEQSEKKNALVKVRLCERCSHKLNYKTPQKRAASQQDPLVLGSATKSDGRATHKRRLSGDGDLRDVGQDKERKRPIDINEPKGREKRSRSHDGSGDDYDRHYSRERSRNSSRRHREEPRSSRSNNSKDTKGHSNHQRDRGSSRPSRVPGGEEGEKHTETPGQGTSEGDGSRLDTRAIFEGLFK